MHTGIADDFKIDLIVRTNTINVAQCGNGRIWYTSSKHIVIHSMGVWISQSKFIWVVLELFDFLFSHVGANFLNQNFILCPRGYLQKKKNQILHPKCKILQAEKANFAIFLHSLFSFSAIQILQSYTQKALSFSK